MSYLHEEGLGLYGNGDFESAVELFTEAAEVYSEPVDKARALRDSSAALVQTGNPGPAEVLIAQSIDILESGDEPRELGASYDAMARLLISQAVHLELHANAEANDHTALATGRSALTYARAAIDEIFKTESDKPDQYRINAVRREVAAEGLYGSRRTAVKLGAGALKLALISESPKRVANANEALDSKGRTRVRVRQAGSIGILFAAGTVNLFGARKTALKLVQKSKV